MARSNNKPRVQIPEPEYQNSAGRLLALLTVIPSNRSIWEVLPEMFELDVPEEKRTPNISAIRQQRGPALQGLIELDCVYRQFIQDMNSDSIPELQRDVLLEGLAGIQDSVYPDSYAAQMRQLTDAEKVLLKVCATLLPMEPQLTDDDLSRIRDSLNDLRNLVETGDISPTLRKHLLELIRLTEDAIARFNIHGARGLKRAFKSMLGEVAELYNETKSDGSEEDADTAGVWATIAKHLRTFDDIASRVLKYKPLLESVAPLLLGDSIGRGL